MEFVSQLEAAEVQLHSSLTSALDTGKWSTSRSGRFTPGRESWYQLNKRPPERVWTILEKIKIPAGIRTPDRPTRS